MRSQTAPKPRRRFARKAQDEARRRQGEDDEADRLVRLIEAESRRGGELRMDHGKALDDELEDQRAREPVERDQERAPARRPSLADQIASAALTIFKSTSRETSG